MKAVRIFALGAFATSALLLAGCSKGDKTEPKPETQAQDFETSCEIIRTDGKLITKGECSASDLAKIPEGDEDFHYKSAVKEGAQKRGH